MRSKGSAGCASSPARSATPLPIRCDLAPTEGSRFRYGYDFGDDWLHDISVQAVIEPTPGTPEVICLKVAGACPPEDCGGPFGYEHLLAILADPGHKEHEEMREWIGGAGKGNWNPAHYDIVAVNGALAARVARWARPARKTKTKGS